jgi:hypothetical protein
MPTGTSFYAGHPNQELDANSEGRQVMPTITTIFEHCADTGKTGVLGIDEDARLYWNGRLIVTEQKIKLSWWVNIAVILGGVSTAVIAIFTALLYLKQC